MCGSMSETVKEGMMNNHTVNNYIQTTSVNQDLWSTYI